MRSVIRVVIAITGGLLVAGPAASASGTPDMIGVQDYAFSPTPYLGTLGGAVEWTNTGTMGVDHPHEPVQNAPLNLWSRAAIAPGVSTSPVNLIEAGTFAYHCAIHPFMHGTVQVPVTTNITTGSVGDGIRVNVATAAHANFTFDVDRKIGAGTWKIYKTGVTGNWVTLKATVAGTYRFKARLVRTKTNAKSGWSPSAAVTIS